MSFFGHPEEWRTGFGSGHPPRHEGVPGADLLAGPRFESELETSRLSLRKVRARFEGKTALAHKTLILMDLNRGDVLSKNRADFGSVAFWLHMCNRLHISRDNGIPGPIANRVRPAIVLGCLRRQISVQLPLESGHDLSTGTPIQSGLRIYDLKPWSRIMPILTRRSFLRQGLAAAAAASVRPKILSAAAETGETSIAPLESTQSFDFKLPQVGRIEPVLSLSIAESPLSVGFETLDRQHFDPTRTYSHLAKLGVKWARCQTGWNRCERTRGRFDFTWLDEVVDSLLKIGIQPWFNLGYGNRLYTPEKPDDYSVGWAPVFSDEALKGWLRFTGAIAGHFRDRVRHWEIWNEPNIGGFWKPAKPDPKDYVAMVKPTAAEIRRIIPNAVIIGGAFAGIPMDYIKGCLENGLADHVDKISYHPYRPLPELNYAQEIKQLRALIAQYKPGIEIWQGENGCPSKGGGDSVGALSKLDWDETRQAKWLLRRILTDLRMGIELTSYFHTVDLVGYRGKTNYKGLLRGSDYSPKPAYRAYQTLCALFDSKTKLLATRLGRRIRVSRIFFQKTHFSRNGRVLCAYWEETSLQRQWTPKRILLQVGIAPDLKLESPVLIDPLSGRVYKIAPKEQNRISVAFEDLPWLDYPLIVTDWNRNA